MPSKRLFELRKIVEACCDNREERQQAVTDSQILEVKECKASTTKQPDVGHADTRISTKYYPCRSGQTASRSRSRSTKSTRKIRKAESHRRNHLIPVDLYKRSEPSNVNTCSTSDSTVIDSVYTSSYLVSDDRKDACLDGYTRRSDSFDPGPGKR